VREGTLRMQLVIRHKILRMRVCRIPRRTHLLICGEYMHLQPLCEGSGRKDVIVKMEVFQVEEILSRF